LALTLLLILIRQEAANKTKNKEQTDKQTTKKKTHRCMRAYKHDNIACF